MTFHVITLFPEVFEAYLSKSIVGMARRKGLIKVKFYKLGDFSLDKHGKVDDRPYGGGPGMVLGVEPLLKAVVGASKSKSKTKVIILTPAGKNFDNQYAVRLIRRYKHLVLIAGRYEGVDARLMKILKDQGSKVEEISVGPYVLTGGELPAMILIDAVSRRIKGVLGKEESLEEKRLGVGVPVYTRPEIFVYKGKKYRVPKALLSGNHARILKWRRDQRKVGK